MGLDVYLTKVVTEEKTVHDSNITHNLNLMAGKAGIYMELWRPDEIGATKAFQIIEPLKAGLAKLKADPAFYKQFDTPNGWGVYDDFVPFVEKYLNACIEHPDADIHVSR